MTPESIPACVEVRRVNGIELEVAVAGESGRATIILLHGFPDLWQGWHFQITPLVAAGFRVLVPNQRGYGRSSKPAGVVSYDLDHLAQDIVALAESERCPTFCLVGHDWGGIVAWWVAARFPERVRRLVILNAPHPGILGRYLLRSPRQALRSWYAGLFQLPWVPEAILSANDYGLLFWSMKKTSQTGVFDGSDLSYLRSGWREPGALRAMLNYYRAAARRSSKTMNLRVGVPTLVLWGQQDPTEELGLAYASLDMCDDGQLIPLQDAAHWVQREKASQVTDEIIRFSLS